MCRRQTIARAVLLPGEPIARAKADAAKKRLAEVVALHWPPWQFAVALPLAETPAQP